MEFAYTPRLAELKQTAKNLTTQIMQYEDDCEANNGLSAESHAAIKQAVLDAGLQAINTPTEYGGAGLSVLEQVVVQDELGKLTNALWDAVWRPANPLSLAALGIVLVPDVVTRTPPYIDRVVANSPAAALAEDKGS